MILMLLLKHKDEKGQPVGFSLDLFSALFGYLKELKLKGLKALETINQCRATLLFDYNGFRSKNLKAHTPGTFIKKSEKVRNIYIGYGTKDLTEEPCILYSIRSAARFHRTNPEEEV